MNWNSILTELIIGLIGVIISGLGIYVTYLINKWIKDQELKDMMNSLIEIVKNAVLEVYQTYVEELKDKDIFDKEAQKIALERALKIIKENIPEKLETWLKTNFTNYQEYLKGLIEAQIGALKNSGR